MAGRGTLSLCFSGLIGRALPVNIRVSGTNLFPFCLFRAFRLLMCLWVWFVTFCRSTLSLTRDVIGPSRATVLLSAIHCCLPFILRLITWRLIYFLGASLTLFHPLRLDRCPVGPWISSLVSSRVLPLSRCVWLLFSGLFKRLYASSFWPRAGGLGIFVTCLVWPTLSLRVGVLLCLGLLGMYLSIVPRHLLPVLRPSFA